MREKRSKKRNGPLAYGERKKVQVERVGAISLLLEVEESGAFGD